MLNKSNSKYYSCISEKFNRSFTFFTHLIDITSYISLYRQFEGLKKFVLNNVKYYNKSENDYFKKINNNNGYRGYLSHYY